MSLFGFSEIIFVAESLYIRFLVSTVPLFFRCGAGVTWKGAAIPLKDYNALPVGNYRRYKIGKVDATDAGINEAGFMYFHHLEELEEVIMKNCT